MRTRVAQAAILVVATALAYHGALSASFVLDDYHYILEHHDLGLRAIPSLFWRAYASGGSSFYRPLSTADLALDRALFGLSAAGFHVANVTWHLAATLAAWWLLGALSSSRAAFAAALLFALHPLHTEAVTGVIGRSELMAAAFVLAGCALYRADRRGLAALAYLLALFSKESGVMLPALAVLVDGRDHRLRRAWPFTVPLAIYGALRVHALGAATLPDAAQYFVVATPAQAMVTAIDVLGREAALTVWPHPLAADYSYPALPIASWPHALATLVGALVLALSARRWQRLRLPLAWFAVAILPVSNLVVHIGVLMAERVLYLPSLAACMLAGLAWERLHARTRPQVAWAALSTVALTFAALTIARNLDWQTPLTLWRDTVAKQPRSALAHANLALSCEVIGDRECVRAHLEQAVALDPSRSDFRRELDAIRR